MIQVGRSGSQRSTICRWIAWKADLTALKSPMGQHARAIQSSVISYPILSPNRYGIGDSPHSFGLFDPREWVNPPTINPYSCLYKVSHKNP